MTDRGLITLESRYSVQETIDRLAHSAEQAGLIVFARIDHSANAASESFELRPTQLVIFGHARGGTPLMLDVQSAGIDLPVKALAWQDAAGQVWLTYNEARWIAERHSLGPASAANVDAIEAAMQQLASIATK